MAQSNTATQRKLEAKALAAATKSEGMRALYEAGYTVSQVAKVFSVGYAFAYGVAKRAGVVLTAAARRPVRSITKATVKAVISRPAAQKAAKAKTAARVAKVAAQTKKPGRPTAARRETNRKPRVATA